MLIYDVRMLVKDETCTDYLSVVFKVLFYRVWLLMRPFDSTLLDPVICNSF